MVHFSQILMIQVTRVARKKFRGSYMDKVHVNIQAGNGGMGNVKFGGIGGKGGDVYMMATKAKDLKTVIENFPERRIKAGHGGNSAAKKLMGARGTDITVGVPRGVKAISDDKFVIGEVNEKDDKVLIAQGGIGGNPATGFSGMRGQKFNVTFELSLIADVGLLGFPNAGKSTLLKACSNAKPRIADYPFTTVKPNIGIVEYADFRRITMADLPGLIEGAHANFGMGHKFLRHIERAKLVLMVVDVCGFQLSSQHKKRSALETIMLLNKELELYNPDYLDKPMALIVNKMDLPGSDDILNEIKDKLTCLSEFSQELPEYFKCNKPVQFEEVIAISASERTGIDKVKDYVRSSLTNIAEKTRIGQDVEERLNALKRVSAEAGPRLV
ncbi:GTP-binding protein 10 homolog [Thrips palmi]|uniref:GTP-binding protein 10 homolog n=1 Tax=Thrips palmi TaxID=161013 RepID=A0A6P9AAF6_THRPL|nr:GTP-binding protein 10 homolog [Thrips palmi]